MQYHREETYPEEFVNKVIGNVHREIMIQEFKEETYFKETKEYDKEKSFPELIIFYGACMNFVANDLADLFNEFRKIDSLDSIKIFERKLGKYRYILKLQAMRMVQLLRKYDAEIKPILSKK